MIARTVGVLGGTFDPIHVGHLHLAEEVRRILRLPRILMMLSARPPHKTADDLAPVAHREAMLRAALEDRPGLEIDTVELERPDVAYSIDTLRWLRDGSRRCTPLFILGMDSLIDLPTWREWRELLREFDLLVADRCRGAADIDGLVDEVRARLVELDDTEEMPGDLELGRGGRVFRMPVQPVAVSSSGVREKAAAGLALDGLVTPSVARYIQTHGLYCKEKRRSRPR